VAQAESRMLERKADLLVARSAPRENADHLLRPGMSVEAKVKLR
jgi:hypothetical protein